MASFNAFKFPSSDNIRFQCNIRVCFGRCQPVSTPFERSAVFVFFFLFFFKYHNRRTISDDENAVLYRQVNCRGYNAFGRRRRDVDSEMNDTSLSVSDGYEGQLREEITIQSNLILTLERKEERYTADPAEGRIRLDGKKRKKKRIKYHSTVEEGIINFCDDFSSSFSATSGRYMCFYGRLYHSVDNYGTPGTGCRSYRCVMLAYGVSTSAKDCWTTATPTRVPESPVHYRVRS